MKINLLLILLTCRMLIMTQAFNYFSSIFYQKKKTIQNENIFLKSTIIIVLSFHISAQAPLIF
jgi:hypothetical protein